MNPERFKMVKRLLGEALGLPEGRRLPWLVETCGTDRQLLEEVVTLLDSEDIGSAPFSERAGLGLSEDEDLEGMRLGPWRLMGQLGQGGMGSVWLAERDDRNFEMSAAVKLVKKARCCPQLIGRFRRERQILADLKHPNIAGLIDGGTTTDGRPYLVMEYVDGLTVEKYCAREQSSLKTRITLLHTLSQAVAYAHRQGIIHRDIKCANVMVTRQAVVKLMDFGIARLADPEVGGDLALTRSGEVLMTPEYAAPEQLAGLPATQSSDIYALGLVLFQLLTNRRPGHHRDIWEAAKAFTLADNPDGALSAKLGQILLGALAGDRAQRYPSAEALARDLAQTLVLLSDEDEAASAREEAASAREEAASAREEAASPREEATRTPDVFDPAYLPATMDEEATRGSETSAALLALRKCSRAWTESNRDDRLLPNGTLLARFNLLMAEHEAWISAEDRALVAAAQETVHQAGQGRSSPPEGTTSSRRLRRPTLLRMVAPALIILLILSLAQAHWQHARTRTVLAGTLAQLARLELEQNHLAEARRHAGEALAVAQSQNHPQAVAQAHLLLGQIQQADGQWRAAIANYRLAVDGFRATNDRKALAEALIVLATLQTKGNNLEQAQALLQEAVAPGGPATEPQTLMRYLHAQALLAAKMGKPDEALARLSEKLTLERALPGDNRAILIESLQEIARFHRQQNNPQKADVYVREAQALRRALFPTTQGSPQH